MAIKPTIFVDSPIMLSSNMLGRSIVSESRFVASMPDKAASTDRRLVLRSRVFVEKVSGNLIMCIFLHTINTVSMLARISAVPRRVGEGVSLPVSNAKGAMAMPARACMRPKTRIASNDLA